MFTRSLSRAALVAASLSLATSGAAHAQVQPLTELWMESILDVQAQLATQLARKFGLSPGELDFRFQILEAQQRVIISTGPLSSYGGRPTALTATIWIDPGTPVAAGSTMSILISGSVGSQPLSGTGQIRINALDQTSGSLSSDMAMVPGGNAGSGGDDGSGGPDDFNDFHSSIIYYSPDGNVHHGLSTHTAYLTLNNERVGEESIHTDHWTIDESGFTFGLACPRISDGVVALSINTIGSLNPSTGIGLSTVSLAEPACLADFNADGAVDFFDYDDFVHAFEDGTPSSDFDHDGTLDFFDYDNFVRAFETPC